MKYLYLLTLSIFSTLLVAQQPASILMEYRKKAVQYNQDIKSINKQVQASQALEKANKTENLPAVSVGGEMAYKTNPLSADLSIPGLLPIQFEGQKVSYGLNTTVIQPIYYGGLIRAQQTQSILHTQILESQSQLTEDEVILKVDRTYWTTVAQSELQSATQDYQLLLSNLTQVIQERVDAGLVGRTDLLTVEVKLNEVDFALKQTESQFKVSCMNLNSLVGDQIQSKPALEKEVPPLTRISNPDSLIHKALSSRPEYQMAQKQVEMAEANTKLKMANYNPQLYVGASASYGVPGPNLTDHQANENLSAFLKVSIPIIEWGKKGYEKRAAQLQEEVAQENRSKVSDAVVLQVQSTYFAFQQAINQVVLSASSINKAKENLALMQERYNEGEASITELIDTQIYLQNILFNNISARLNAQIAQSEFNKAVSNLSVQ